MLNLKIVYEKGLEWFASAWDINSQKILESV